MKYLSSLLLVISLHAYSTEQLNIINKVYNESKEFNLGLTMTAILIQESDAGKYIMTINKNSIDCGIFMINSNTLANNHWNQSRICERLVKDNDFSTVIAIKRFKYFYNYYRSRKFSKLYSWRHAVMSYHSGWKYKAGKQYLKSIVKKMKIVRKLIKGK